MNIKKVLVSIALFLMPLLSFSQTGGFVTINDFGLPNYPYQFTRFWLRGSTPAGSNPIMEFYGLSNIKMYTDSVTVTKLFAREDGTPNKLVWVGSDGMLRASTPTYLTGITSGDVTTALGYSPVNPLRSLTINGVSQNLSADRTWSVGDVVTTGSYSDPTWIASLSNSKISYSGTTSQYVRGDGSLASFPSIPATQVNSDWNANTGVAQILNKPALATVATTGSYVDLTNKPTIPAAQIQSDWTQSNTGIVDYIKNKPTLSTVATTGSYTDLSNKPTIPAAQVNSDWTSVSGVSQILNKPTLLAYYHNGVIATAPKIETFSATVAGGAGNAVVYLTDNGLVTGNALYTNVNYVLPFVNDASTNYTYAYTISGDKKTLTINVKGTPAINVALLSLTLLGVPTNVANGTAITALVVGN